MNSILTGKIIMACYVLLHPYQGDGYNTTVIRINKKTPEACHIAATAANVRSGQNNCTCHAVRKYPPPKMLTPIVK